MANIFFVAKGTGGDLVPFPKIGAKLKERGHHVTLFSHCSYASMAEQNGWDFVALDTEEQRKQILDDGHLLNSPASFPTYIRRHVLPQAVNEYEAIRERHVPGKTLLLTTHKACLVPLLATEKLGIPLVRMFATLSELVTLPLMEEMYRAVLGSELNQTRATLGLPPLEKGNTWLRKAEKELALWPDWFAPAETDWPVPAVPVGFVEETGEAIDAALLDKLKGTEPPILITAGTGLFTDPRFYAASAEACSQIHRRGILVTRYPQLVPNNLPEQVQHFDRLPFATLMPHMAAIVHHGGVGTLACALAAGIPQLVLASGGDRPENGERIQRLGVGEFLLPSHWKPQMIASALERLLTTQSVQENCQIFAQRMRSTDAAEAISSSIESVLSRSAAPKTFAPTPSAAKTADLINKLSPEKQALLAKRLQEKRQQAAKPANTELEIISGPVPLIPMLMLDYVYRPPQSWWRAFEMLVEVPRIVRPAQIRETLQYLIAYHDGLRLRLSKENAEYRMFIAPSSENAFEERDLSALPTAEQDEAIQTAKEELWASLNFSTGPLFRVVFFELGSQRLPQMLIVVHHFIIDAYSMGLLLANFETVCQQILIGGPVSLPGKVTSVKKWAEIMYTYAKSEAAKTEIAYWKSLPWAKVRPTPADHPQVSKSLPAVSAGYLSEDETQALLAKVPTAYNVRLWDVLIAACAVTYARYAQLQPLLILMLHHGRNLGFDKLDLFHTVGNLYSSYPLLLDIDLSLSAEDPAAVLKRVAGERMRVPDNGAAWHWVSYYSSDEALSWSEIMKITPNVVFNYLGETQANTQLRSKTFREIFTLEDEATPQLYDITQNAPHTCETAVESGRFKVAWEYFSARDEKATIERLIQEYLGILRSWIKATG